MADLEKMSQLRALLRLLNRQIFSQQTVPDLDQRWAMLHMPIHYERSVELVGGLLAGREPARDSPYGSFGRAFQIF